MSYIAAIDEIWLVNQLKPPIRNAMWMHHNNLINNINTKLHHFYPPCGFENNLLLNEFHLSPFLHRSNNCLTIAHNLMQLEIHTIELLSELIRFSLIFHQIFNSLFFLVSIKNKSYILLLTSCPSLYLF